MPSTNYKYATHHSFFIYFFIIYVMILYYIVFTLELIKHVGLYKMDFGCRGGVGDPNIHSEGSKKYIKSVG